MNLEMDTKVAELLEKVRLQFEQGPYPRNPLENSPKNDFLSLYIHNLVTPYYLRNQIVIDTKGKDILDAGCGTGFTSLILAEANPGANIVGIDISEKSVELAKQRLQYHGFEQAEFYAMSIEELPKLERKFDYINCDEVLYLLPDPVVGLQSMKALLKPEGIIRSNLHSSLTRAHYYRAQAVCRLMGLMDENPGETEMEILQETMKALKDEVVLKAQTWGEGFVGNEEKIFSNHLLQGDKGSTIPELFAAFEKADLEFISMVNWRQWGLMSLFKNPDDLPVFWGLALPEISIQAQLHLFELLQPIHRLLDFWCGHPQESETDFTPISEWAIADWENATIHLHPQLKSALIKDAMLQSVARLQPFEISRFLPIAGKEILVDSTIVACLAPLWDEPQTMEALVKRSQQLRPVNPMTLEPIPKEEAFEIVRQTLIGLESSGYVLIQ